ncbi:MAG: glycerophosphodiester phosphodiesterase [Mariniphaga sp.]|nr:glycerophosphodiester phosphodiesterase [Mariniphaga sp.]
MKIIITLSFLILAIISFSQTKFIAHRGASFLAPENTIASAKLGWELGADAVEIDIHLSMDNRVMVIHDKNTKRTCKGKNMEVKSSPSTLLRDLDAGSFKDEKFKGEKIPFLSEVIEIIPENRKLVIELKSGSDIIPQVKRVVEKTSKSEQLVFISFNWDAIVKTKSEFPDNACYWLSALKPGLKKRMEKAAEIGLEGVNLRFSLIDEKIMALANELGLEILSWTVDDPKEAKRLSELGVKQITTNRPKWLKEELDKL